MGDDPRSLLGLLQRFRHAGKPSAGTGKCNREFIGHGPYLSACLFGQLQGVAGNPLGLLVGGNSGLCGFLCLNGLVCHHAVMVIGNAPAEGSKLTTLVNYLAAVVTQFLV